MSNPLVIAECKEPWVYWWLWLPAPSRKRTREKYFPNLAFLGPATIKEMWEKENPAPLTDNEWLQLAQTALIYEEHLSGKDRQEIWRQVYRIASERI